MPMSFSFTYRIPCVVCRMLYAVCRVPCSHAHIQMQFKYLIAILAFIGSVCFGVSYWYNLFFPVWKCLVLFVLSPMLWLLVTALYGLYSIQRFNTLNPSKRRTNYICSKIQIRWIKSVTISRNNTSHFFYSIFVWHDVSRIHAIHF